MTIKSFLAGTTALTLLAHQCFGDRIQLTDGTSANGAVVEIAESHIIFQKSTSANPVTIARDLVCCIERGGVVQTFSSCDCNTFSLSRGPVAEKSNSPAPVLIRGKDGTLISMDQDKRDSFTRSLRWKEPLSVGLVTLGTVLTIIGVIQLHEASGQYGMSGVEESLLGAFGTTTGICCLAGGTTFGIIVRVQRQRYVSDSNLLEPLRPNYFSITLACITKR